MVESKVKPCNNLVIEKHQYTSQALLIIVFIENLLCHNILSLQLCIDLLSTVTAWGIEMFK